MRRKLVETGDVDVMISIRSNFFYTRTIPCELWHFDKGKLDDRRDQVLMIDARDIYRKVTRKIYDFTPEQSQNLTAIVWLYRGQTGRLWSKGMSCNGWFNMREWFVRLRFPGHEHTRLTHGVPQGWERKTLGDICDDIREIFRQKNLNRTRRISALNTFRAAQSRSANGAKSKT